MKVSLAGGEAGQNERLTPLDPAERLATDGKAGVLSKRKHFAMDGCTKGDPRKDLSFLLTALVID